VRGSWFWGSRARGQNLKTKPLVYGVFPVGPSEMPHTCTILSFRSFASPSAPHVSGTFKLPLLISPQSNSFTSRLGDIVSGAFTPVLAKHTKHLSLVDILSVGVDRTQRNFEPMRKQVEAWKATRLPDDTAKLVIYRAFVEGKFDTPKHLAQRVRRIFQPAGRPVRSANPSSAMF